MSSHSENQCTTRQLCHNEDKCCPLCQMVIICKSQCRHARLRNNLCVCVCVCVPSPQEQEDKAMLQEQVQHLRQDNMRLHEESQTAAAQLRRFSEWFLHSVDNKKPWEKRKTKNTDTYTHWHTATWPLTPHYLSQWHVKRDDVCSDSKWIAIAWEREVAS